jgi:hypothetical protein
MEQTTYENLTTGTMKIKYEKILTIEHEEIGTIYHIPIEGNMGMFFTPSEIQGPFDPETREPLMIPILSPALLNAEELAIIVSHLD